MGILFLKFAFIFFKYKNHMFHEWKYVSYNQQIKTAGISNI